MPFRLPHRVGRRIELSGAPRFVPPTEITQRMVPGKRFSRVDELGVPAAGPVDFPDGVANLRFRYRADLGVTKDGSNLVSQWDDQSGNDDDLTTGVAPLWVDDLVNGYPAIRFDGSNDWLAKTGATAYDHPHIFMVLNQVTWTSADVICYLWVSGVSAVWQQKTSSPIITIGGDTGDENPVTPPSLGTFFLLNGANDGTTAGFNQVNDDTIVTGASHGYDPINLTTVYLTTNTGPYNWGNIEVAEFIIYEDGPLSVSDRESVKSYLNSRYALY